MDGMDWNVAQRVGEMLAGGTDGWASQSRSDAGGVQSLAERFAARVGDYTGLQPPEHLPTLELIDRPRWI